MGANSGRNVTGAAPKNGLIRRNRIIETIFLPLVLFLQRIEGCEIQIPVVEFKRKSYAPPTNSKNCFTQIN